MAAAARAECIQLRTMGVQVIIALSHMRECSDIAFVAEAPDVDVVLSGHDHFWKLTWAHETPILTSGTDFRQMSLVKLWCGDGKPSVKVPLPTLRVL